MSVPDDAGLTAGEADRFAAIVSREWPGDGHPGGTRNSIDLHPYPAADGDDEPARVTVFQPRRPGPLLPLTGTAVLAASLVVALQWGMPAYLRASGHLPGRVARIDVAHDLALIAAVLAAGLVVACALLGAWVVRWAGYRLRRSAVVALCRDDQSAVVHRVHPPNIATALAWVLMLAAASALATWWIWHELDLLAAGAPWIDARAPAEHAALTGAAWCAVLVVAATGLTAWSARESRHRLRVRAQARVLT